MLGGLHDDFAATSAFYYFSISFEETLQRHATRPLSDTFGREEMAGWYRRDDRLTGVSERVINEHDSLHRVIERIQAETGLPNVPSSS